MLDGDTWRADDVSNGSDLPSFLSVEYSTTGDGQVAGSTISDAKGNFTFTPVGLTPGTVTVEVRGVMQDPQTGQDVDGPWKTITFELAQDTNGQTPTPPQVTDTLTGADSAAATSQMASEQGVDEALAGFNSAIGAGGTSGGQIALGAGTYTAFSTDSGGRVASGSIYDFENGSLPSAGQSGTGTGGNGGGSGGSGNPSLPQSSPVGVPGGAAINFTGSFSTPQAGSVSVNEPISGNSALGPGNNNVSGSLIASDVTTAGPDPNQPNVTDWTVEIDISWSYSNIASGGYSITGGGVSTVVSFDDAVSGSYHFHYKAWGTTTVTSIGTIVAGTFTLNESNDYQYSWNESVGVDTSIPGQGSTVATNSSDSGSSSFWRR
ncbi:MAG TPA: hypothetical protein VFI31_04320, partial [Pirellulales bacterium]|nr:hypothetical protein [Pirellulales bacterium]